MAHKRQKSPSQSILYKPMVYTIIILIAASLNLFSEELIQDTTLTCSECWFQYVSEVNGPQMALSFGSGGCTVSVARHGAHEYEASIDQRVTIKKEKTYTITVVAASDSPQSISVGFRQNQAPWFHYAMRELHLKTTPDTFTLQWVNSGSDAINPSDAIFSFLTGKLKGKLIIQKVSVKEQDVTTQDINAFACPTKRQITAKIGNITELPKGYVVFTDTSKRQICISELNRWVPIAIPGLTANAQFLSISDDGRWILYHVGTSSYVIRIDGKYKTRVPGSGDFCSVGFVRSGPYGPEIFGDSKLVETIIGIQVTFNDTSVSFGSQRIIAKLGPKYEFDNYYRITLSKDQIWTAINPILSNSVSSKRSGFLTIPDSGRSTASDVDVYKFKNDDFEQMYGCNHAMSFDGAYCVAVPGGSGETGDFSHCSPSSHKGFYVSRFYRTTDTSVENREHVYRYANSLNFCPSQYWIGEWDEVDIGNYYFTNNNSYIIGTQGGNLSTRNGLWAIRWEDNTWYPLSPDSTAIKSTSAAAYIGDFDSKLLSVVLPDIDTTASETIDNNPIGYKILNPAGGELFHPGELCTIQVTSKVDGNAAVKLQFGKQSFSLLSHPVNPKVDSLIVITIPQFFYFSKLVTGVITRDSISPYSNECSIVLQHYTAGVCDPVYSNGYFTIAPEAGTGPSVYTHRSREVATISNSTIDNFILTSRNQSITQCTLYDLMGRIAFKWNILSGDSFPYSALKQFDTHAIYVIRYSFVKIK